jgi:hypothetical protein
MIERGAGDLGEAACKVCVEIRFQGEAWKAAGGRRGGSVLRLDEEGLDLLRVKANEKMLEGAPERGGGDRGEEEARGSLAASESAGEACRCAKLRRRISSSSVCPERRDERER